MADDVSPDHATVAVLTLQPRADAVGRLVRRMAAAKRGVLAAASLDALRRAVERLPPRAIVAIDHDHLDADAALRWLKASPARAGIRVVAYNLSDDAFDDGFRVWPDAQATADTLADVVAALADDAPPPRHTVRCGFPAPDTTLHLDDVRAWLDELLDDSSLPPAERAEFGIGVMEAVDNIRHESADTNVHIVYKTAPLAVSVRVGLHPPPESGRPGFQPSPEFEAWSVDPASLVRARARAGRRGGVGLVLMHRCSDRVRYLPDRHAVTLFKYAGPLAARRPRAVAAH